MSAGDKAGAGAAPEVDAQIKLQNIFEQQMTPPDPKEIIPDGGIKEPVQQEETQESAPDDQPETDDTAGSDEGDETEGTVLSDETEETPEENIEFTGVDPEQEAEPDVPTAPAIAAPVGMRDTEAAEFAKLSPDLQTFLVQQEANRTSDYQRKTTEMAEQRKQTEALKSQYSETLEQQKQALEQFVTKQGSMEAPSVELSVSDPDQYIRELAVYSANKEQQDAALDEHNRISDEQTRLYQERQNQFVHSEAQKLVGLVPEIGDPEKGKKLADDLNSYAQSTVGLSSAQLNSLTAQEIHTIYKAYKLDTAEKVTKAPRKTVKRPPKAARAKATSSTATKSQRKRIEVKKRLSKTKDLKDLATLFLDEV